MILGFLESNSLKALGLIPNHRIPLAGFHSVFCDRLDDLADSNVRRYGIPRLHGICDLPPAHLA